MFDEKEYKRNYHQRKTNCDMDGMGYIYMLVHPQTKEIRYIGQTKKKLGFRLSGHITAAQNNKTTAYNTPVSKWIRKLLALGLYPSIYMLECLPIEKLNDAEKKYIAIGRKSFRLLNVEDGGIISGKKIGTKMSAEFCKRQSEQRSGFNNQNFRDRSGERYNKLIVVSLDRFEDKKSWWLCKCDCGNTKIIPTSRLKRHKSCGCAKKTRWTEEEREKYRQYVTSNRKFDENGKFTKNMG